MAKYAVVDSTTEIVQNIIEWDGKSDYTPPEGTYTVQSDCAAIDDMYYEKEFWRKSAEVTKSPEEEA